MPVQPLEHGQRPAPNHLHVLLPNQIARLSCGLFKVQSRSSDGKHPMVIDTFFRSLASDQKNYAIGVVLSGADSDGASGLKAIKGEGGFALVQTPESAQHSSMPRMSIAADHVDLVVPPRELATELNRLGAQFRNPEVRLLEEAEAPLTDEQSFTRILQSCARRQVWTCDNTNLIRFVAASQGAWSCCGWIVWRSTCASFNSAPMS